MRSALGRLIAVSESYPDLKANQNFLELQAQLEGTENRIAVARKGLQRRGAAVQRFGAPLPGQPRRADVRLPARSPISSRPKGPRPLRRSPSK